MSHMLILLCFNAFSVMIGNSVCYAQSYEDQERLMDQLIDQQRYRKDIRPVQNLTETLQVNFTHEIRIIEAVDVPAADICVLSYINISWFDHKIRWNSSNFHGLSTIDIPVGLIWSPILDGSFSKKCRSTEKQQELKVTKVSSNGRVELNMIKYLTTFCMVDMYLYPFDEHECIFLFYDSKYTDTELKLHLIEEEFVHKDKFIENQEWNLKKSISHSYSFQLFDNANYSTVSNYLLINRRPGFIMVNLFLPAWLLSFLNICVTLIPPDSGERLSFAVTLCLAMIFVNMSLVADMPKNSLKISALSWLLITTDILHTIGILWSIFIIRISKSSSATTKIPVLLRKLLRKPKQYKFDETQHLDNSSDKKHDNLNTIYADLQNETKLMPDKKALEDTCIHEEADDIGWYEVAKLLDKMFFITSIVIVLIMSTFNWMIFGENVSSLFKGNG